MGLIFLPCCPVFLCQTPLLGLMPASLLAPALPQCSLENKCTVYHETKYYFSNILRERIQLNSSKQDWPIHRFLISIKSLFPLTCCVRCWKPCRRSPGTCWRGSFPSSTTSSPRRDPHRLRPCTSSREGWWLRPILQCLLPLPAFSLRNRPSCRWAASRGGKSCPGPDELK